MVTADELAARLRERLAVHGGDLEVRIRSDRSVAYANVEPILLACARAGIWNVSFAVFRREDAK
jgi:biopolymer transport protein ExbD